MNVIAQKLQIKPGHRVWGRAQSVKSPSTGNSLETSAVQVKSDFAPTAETSVYVQNNPKKPSQNLI